MKILFLTPWYPDEKSKNHGVFIREQANAVATKHEVVLISSKIDDQQFGLMSYSLTESVYGQVKEYRLVIKRSLPLYNQLNYFLVSRKVSVKIAKAFRPDLIHGNIGYPGGFWSWLVSTSIKKPYLITEHTFIHNNFRSWVHKRLTLFSMRKAKELITVSGIAASEIRKYINRDVHVVHNIVDTQRFSIQPYSTEKVNIGFLGRLSSTHVKGLDLLMRAISLIKDDFVLHIGGDGPMMEEYKSMAGKLGIIDKCKFYGFVDYTEVPPFMNRLHFFVNSSRFESFGIAIVEALASGLPVVSFNNGGPRDYINSSNGILVENQNKEKLIEALQWMISNYKSFDRERIKRDMSCIFSRSSFIDRMNSMYRDALDKK